MQDLATKFVSLFRREEQGPEEFHLEVHMRGALYGNAIGDAIGLLTEFLVKEEVKKYYGKHKHLEYEYKIPDMHRDRWKMGDWTDDTDQMILIMDMLIEHNGKVDVVDFASRMHSWVQHGFPELGDSCGMGLGATTNKVVTNPRFLKEPHASALEVWEANQRRMAPNGGVMRTSILGIHQYWDVEKVKENTMEICKVTHADPRCVASCIAVTTAIAIMLERHPRHVKSNGHYDVKVIMEDSFSQAKTVLPDEETVTLFQEHMFASSLSKLKLAEPGKIGYTLKCMGAGFWAFRQDDFRLALECIVREAGDADTNGAVAGALLGCKLGYDNLPQSWTENLVHRQWFEEKIVRFLTLVHDRPDEWQDHKHEEEQP